MARSARRSNETSEVIPLFDGGADGGNQKPASVFVALPAYLEREAWEAFVAMRKQIKKPLSQYAAKLVVYELQRIKSAGHDPNKALEQSILHCWSDVYPAKQKTLSGGSKTFRELDEEQASEQVAKMTGGLVSSRRKPEVLEAEDVRRLD